MEKIDFDDYGERDNWKDLDKREISKMFEELYDTVNLLIEENKDLEREVKYLNQDVKYLKDWVWRV